MTTKLLLLLPLLTLLVWVGGSLSDHNQPRSTWPCPEPSDIAPCVCTRDGDFIDMDCSNVKDDIQLEESFQAYIPFYNFRNLILVKDEAGERIPIINITKTTFSNASFANIQIIHTNLSYIAPDAFARSFPTLTIMDVSDSFITSFPFDILVECPLLEELRLDRNNIGHMSDLYSTSLVHLTINYNPSLVFGDEVFFGVPNLVRLTLSNLRLPYLADGTFSQQSSLTYLDLRNNMLETLYNGSFHFNGPINQVNLNNNKILHIQKAAITGLNPGTVLLMQDNGLTDLPQQVWEPIFKSVAGPDEQIIMLKGNPIQCECNLLWVVQDPTYFNLLAENLECDTGLFLVDVIDIIINNC